ncbi:MAG: hypothetical protein APR54_07215 [Candidatus Cloacimonas sp. SDB]|nr:MAG: hypothetical protein APR54_07215 [Candidatus Cloacimonas sp. SDB]
MTGKIFRFLSELFLIPLIFVYSIYSRFRAKKIDVGIGPDPLINNVYHKKALELYGYETETFVVKPYYITNEFDIDLNYKYNKKYFLKKMLVQISLIKFAFKYRCLYLYFNGGPLSFPYNYSVILWKLEPLFYKIAGVKTVLLPYGSDVQDLSLSRNLYFKHSMNKQYPKHKNKRVLISKKIDLWTKYADHIISGCEWVDYMYYWDTLMLAHFSIDISIFSDFSNSKRLENKTMRILHAPNHRFIKGTDFLEKIVNELKTEGYLIDLMILQNVNNSQIINAMKTVDLVADQFIIGWYAMFAIEAMACKKPVLCYLREDLIDLYRKGGLIDNDEIPIINTDLFKIKEKIIWAYNNRDELKKIGEKSREFVIRHHSIEYIGSIFDQINQSIGVKEY